MKKLFLTMLLSAAFTMGCAQNANDAFMTIEVDGFHHTLENSGDDCVLVDVRTPAEYKEGHLKGAINIDVKAYDVTIEITDEENGWLEYNSSDDIYLDVNISNNKISIEEEDSSTIVNTFFAKIFSLRDRGFQGYLHIYCPKDKMFDLCINTVSGDVKVKDVKCDEIEFESVSGDMKLQDVFSRDLNIDTVSGDFNSQKITIIDTFKAQSVSGDFNIGDDHPVVNNNKDEEPEDESKE